MRKIISMIEAGTSEHNVQGPRASTPKKIEAITIVASMQKTTGTIPKNIPSIKDSNLLIISYLPLTSSINSLRVN